MRKVVRQSTRVLTTISDQIPGGNYRDELETGRSRNEYDRNHDRMHRTHTRPVLRCLRNRLRESGDQLVC